MSRGLRGSNNGEQDFELRDTLQRTGVEQLDGDAGHLRQECDQRNEHEQPSKPCESNKCICDPGSNATCTCSGAPTIDRSTVGHTSFPCKHCGDHIGSTGLGSKYKYTVHRTIADHVERDYAEYIAATSTGRENTSTGVRDSDESRDFKQANASSGDTVERCTGIPAGVTV
jgi:hypothetical protein